MQSAMALFCEFMQWSYKTDCPKGTTEWVYSPVSIKKKSDSLTVAPSFSNLCSSIAILKGRKIYKDW